MTSLPADDTAWPPSAHATRYGRFGRLLAWYSGDPAQLAATHGQGGTVIQGGPATTVNPSGVKARIVGAFRSRFWANGPADGETDSRRHLPTAQDIATISSELLFSDPPKFTVRGTVDKDGTPDAATAATQARLDYLLDACGFHATLLAAAELSSVLGSTGLRVVFDKAGTINDRPMLARVDADATIPLYSWGQLVGVMFWRVVLNDQHDVIWRHLELHEGGSVYHALYKGSGDTIGKRQPLGALNVTAALADLVDADGRVFTMEGQTTAVSIPNMLPDPLDRQANAGRSDFTEPVLDLLDSIDRTYTYMMDSIEDAKSRLLVSESMLQRGRPGEGVSFDPSQRIFTTLKVPPAEKEGGGLPIEKVQFEMHVAEYLSAIDSLISRAIKAAGYNPQTMGDEDGAAAVTATEIRARNARSMSTRDKKIRYWQNPLEALVSSLLAIDVAQFASYQDGIKVLPLPVAVEFPEAVQPTLMELAATAQAVKESGGASVAEVVKILHPEWTPAEVNAEADRILGQGSVIDASAIGLGGAGVGAGDGI